jgi:hypothetical protein
MPSYQKCPATAELEVDFIKQEELASKDVENQKALPDRMESQKVICCFVELRHSKANGIVPLEH